MNIPDDYQPSPAAVECDDEGRRLMAQIIGMYPKMPAAKISAIAITAAAYLAAMLACSHSDEPEESLQLSKEFFDEMAGAVVLEIEQKRRERAEAQS